MTLETILSQIDAEIARLQQAKALLAGISAAKASTHKPAAQPKKKRTMSAAAKKRIAAAQRKRWAAVRAAKKSEK